LRAILAVYQSGSHTACEKSPLPNPNATNDLRHDFARGQKLLLKPPSEFYTHDHARRWFQCN
jgi:hypothetical protein